MVTRDWNDDIAAFVAWMRTANLTPDTISLRRGHLRLAAREIQRSPWTLELADLVEWMAAHEWAPNTSRSYRCTLRSFYAWGQAVGRRSDSPAHLLPAVRVPRSKPRPTPEDGFVDALGRATGPILIAVRLAGHCGMRRGEIVKVRREDLEQDLGGWSLRVRGKGRHVRLVPVNDDLAAAIRRCPPGWLFPSPSRPSHLTPAHLGRLVSRMLPDGYSTHTLRHRCGTRSLQVTKDIRAVQELLGHASVATTMIYTEVGDDAVRDAMRAASA